MTYVSPSGYTCECGKDHKFPAYVYAHMDIELTHTCTCGRRHIILRGAAEPANEEKPRAKEDK